MWYTNINNCEGEEDCYMLFYNFKVWHICVLLLLFCFFWVKTSTANCPQKTLVCNLTSIVKLHQNVAFYVEFKIFFVNFSVWLFLFLILFFFKFYFITLKTLMTAPCGATVISCVRTGSAPITAAVERATLWSNIDTVEQTYPVSGTFMACFIYRTFSLGVC